MSSDKPPLTEIVERFDRNTKRVEDLIGIFDYLDEMDADPHPMSKRTDVLRAAVVFLHAALEEVLRGLLEWRMPDAKGQRRATTLTV